MEHLTRGVRTSQVNDDNTCVSVNATDPGSIPSSPTISSLQANILPFTPSPASIRPPCVRNRSRAYPLSPPALSDAIESNGLVISPPQTPPQASDAVCEATTSVSLLPPNELNPHVPMLAENLPVCTPGFGQVLINKPSVLISDEPTFGPCPETFNFSFKLPPKNVITPPLEADDPLAWSGAHAASTLLGSGTTEGPREQLVDTTEASRTEVIVPVTGTLGETGGQIHDGSGTSNWIADIAKAISFDGPHVNILSHAFPSPEKEAHMIWRILQRMSVEKQDEMPQTFITFAVPRDYTLSQLPGSSASTPQAQETPEEDYFTTKIRSMALPNVDQQQSQISPMAMSGSLDLTVIERLIPPSTTKEVNDMLSPDVDGYLGCRLKELTSRGGHLVFIHPTRAGTQTFDQEYRQPSLDPVLRSMTVQYDLTTRFSETMSIIGSTEAVPHFDSMHASLSALCESMSTPETDERLQANESARASEASYGPISSHGIVPPQVVRESQANKARPPHDLPQADQPLRSNVNAAKHTRYTVTYATKVYEHLKSRTWSKLWAEQNKGRIGNYAEAYYKNMKHHLPRGEYDVLPKAMLIEELMIGVGRKSKDVEDQAKASGTDMDIELAVFVIEKTCT